MNIPTVVEVTGVAGQRSPQWLGTAGQSDGGGGVAKERKKGLGLGFGRRRGRQGDGGRGTTIEVVRQSGSVEGREEMAWRREGAGAARLPPWWWRSGSGKEGVQLGLASLVGEEGV